MKQDQKDFQSLLQKFFLQWLMSQRKVSPETVKTYRDTFRLFIRYSQIVQNIKPSDLTINCLEAEYIMGFLDFLENIRHNKPQSINNRLAAINSFLRFISFEMPEYSGMLTRSLMIPYKTMEKRSMDFLNRDEYEALLNACNSETELGRRDKLMLLILYNTGVRISELTGIRIKDIILDADGMPSYLHIMGKGRKERNIPLWKSTAKFLSKYTEVHESGANNKLFVNRVEGDLTRSGVRYRLACLVSQASEAVPTMKNKTISAHTFRHTVALNLLQSGIDISTIAIWLGHESILTTHKYMEADMEMKRRTLEKVQEPSKFSYSYRPDNTILAFLDSL